MAKIDFTSDEFGIRSGFFSHKKYRWRSVRSIYSMKIDKITYEELCLVLNLEADHSVTIGAFDEGFKAFEMALLDRFDSINRDWRAKTEGTQSGVPVVIWH